MRKEDRVPAEGASCREILSGERLVIATALTLKGGSGRQGRKGKPQICPREVIVLPLLTLQKQIPVQAAAPNPALKEQDTHTATSQETGPTFRGCWLDPLSMDGTE